MIAETDGALFLADIERLESLLKKQAELARRGDIAGVEVLIEQTNRIVKRIAEAGILDEAQYKDKRKGMGKLFGELCLNLAAARAGTARQLSRIRKSKKIIKAYRSS